MALLGKLGNYKNFGLLIIRLGLGVMFIWHGYPKLIGGPEMWKQIGENAKFIHLDFAPILWGLLSGVAEGVGGVLLILGLAFRPVCLLLIINLTVAALFHMHQTGPIGGIGGASHAIEDGVTFLGLLFVGPGRYSIDKR